MKPLLLRLLREPLFHFLAIGGLMFAVFTALNDASEPPPDVIVIGPERIDQIAAGFESVWRRKPAEDELDALIEEDVREEVYYREATRSMALTIATSRTRWCASPAPGVLPSIFVRLLLKPQPRVAALPTDRYGIDPSMIRTSK